eukprot:64123-Alexandrium_andersonii.AAC.1
MSASLVGSEMCIRDSPTRFVATCDALARPPSCRPTATSGASTALPRRPCLLYTSDAADDM